MHPAHRRAGVLSAALVSSAISFALHAAVDPVSLEAAAQAMRSGDAARAAAIYETLSQQGESLEAETGLVRALLQSGEFRKAISFGNLVAGEHPESADAQALLAFLSDRSGRTEQAFAALGKLESAAPGEWSPIAVHAEILVDRNAPEQALALIKRWIAAHPEPPELKRLAARATAAAGTHRSGARAAMPTEPSWLATSFQPLPIGGRRIVAAGNGVVIEGGTTVLTYSAIIPAHAREILIRNGLGRVTHARVDPAPGSGDLVRLRLVAPFPATSSVPLDHVAGPEGVRFCFVLGFSTPARQTTADALGRRVVRAALTQRGADRRSGVKTDNAQ